MSTTEGTSPVAERSIDPELRALVDAAMPAAALRLPRPWPRDGETEQAWLADVAAVRAEHESAHVPPPVETASDGVAASEVAIPVDGGHITARVYRPPGDGPFPGLVLFHGGGFWLGGGAIGLAAGDGGCRLLCSQVDAVVVNVDYRMAPEHRFPVPLEDCYAATAWVAANADAIDVDQTRIAVGGASAGGNLAAAVALLARDRGPGLCFQQLLVPATDATLGSPSIEENGEGFEMTADVVRNAWEVYLGREVEALRTDGLASPLHAGDLSGLPPAQIVVGEFDPIRDDGVRYALRLEAAGVPTEILRLHMTHAIAAPEVGRRYLSAVVDALRRAFGDDANGPEQA